MCVLACLSEISLLWSKALYAKKTKIGADRSDRSGGMMTVSKTKQWALVWIFCFCFLLRFPSSNIRKGEYLKKSLNFWHRENENIILS